MKDSRLPPASTNPTPDAIPAMKFLARGHARSAKDCVSLFSTVLDTKVVMMIKTNKTSFTARFGSFIA